MIIRSSVSNRKEELKNVDINLINDLFSEVKIDKFHILLEKIFVQKVDNTMTSIMYDNISNIDKEEFIKQYEKHKNQGLLTTMIGLKLKFN